MPTPYNDLKSRISSINDYPAVIQIARTEANITSLNNTYVYTGEEIPFNLEREYFDLLLDEGRVKEAKIVLDRMKSSYKTGVWQNLIEGYEYRLSLIEKTNKLVIEKLAKAETDFNQHTLYILTITVGVITIFGTANQAFHVNDFNEAVFTFKTISFTVIVLVLLASAVNSLLKQRH